MSIVRSPATDPRMAANILESLRLMKPADLERFGEMHKSDPYMFSLAFNESNIRKKVGASAQMQGAQQPPVNEQALQGMRADASVAAPEDSGIAQLNTGDMNYADGGIVAFAGGGKSVAAPSFDDALDAEGVTDPTQRAFLKSLYAQESSSGKKATTSNRGAVGGMQILPGTFKEVADPGMDIRNPLDNMRAGIRYGMKGYQAAKGDPVLAGAHYYGGPGGLQALAAGAARKDPVNPTAPDTRQYGESIAKRMAAMLPIGSAQAAQTLSPTPDLVSQIPAGGTSGAPTPAARDDRSYFGKLADTAGIPEEYQRNISNTLSALGGFSMPTAWASKAANLASKGLEPTAEAVATAARLKQVAETPRLMPPAKAGLEALDQAAQATRASATAARQARGLAADVQAAKGAEQSVDAATRSAQLAREMEAALRAKSAATGINAAKVANVGRGVTGMQALDQALREDTGAGEAVPPMAKETFRKLEREPSAPPTPIAPEQKKELTAAAKATMTPEERKESGFTSDDWLTLGFSLLSSKSPQFMEALGSAGLATLAGKQARTKAGLEAQKTAADIAQSGAMSKYYGAAADRYAAEDRPAAQMRKELAAAYLKLESDIMLKLDPVKMAAAKRQVDAEIAARYPELADTIGGAGPSLDLTKWGTPAKI